MINKFIVTPKEDKSVTMTIRIDKNLQERYNDLSDKTNRSRNELINMALRYALENMELKRESECPL
jgi:predicted transcriptional regulator